jgi:hypothetical protein
VEEPVLRPACAQNCHPPDLGELSRPRTPAINERLTTALFSPDCSLSSPEPSDSRRLCTGDARPSGFLHCRPAGALIVGLCRTEEVTSLLFGGLRAARSCH